LGSVPSSTTVQSSEATFWPRRPLYADEAVADGLVQQHARPARAEHDRHAAGRRRRRVEQHERLAHGLARVGLGLVALQEVFVAGARAAAGAGLLAPAVALDDHRDVHAHERPHVGAERAVARGHEHGLVRGREGDDHVRDRGVGRTRGGVGALEQRELLLGRQARERVARRVQRDRRLR
jgi:hypothetical protein